MNQLRKNLKLSCIACLFVGFAALVVGVVAGVTQAFDADALATLICGAAAGPAGAQASRLANVPSNAAKVRTLSLLTALAALVAGAVSYAIGDPTPLQLAALCLVFVCAALMTLFAQRQAKINEQV